MTDDLAAIQRRHEELVQQVRLRHESYEHINYGHISTEPEEAFRWWKQHADQLHADRGALLDALARARADKESMLASLADVVNMGLRDAGRFDKQIARWSEATVKGAINEMAYAYTALQQERDTLRAQVQALQGRVVLVGEGDVYRPPTPDEWQMLFDKRSLQVEISTLREQLEGAQHARDRWHDLHAAEQGWRETAEAHLAQARAGLEKLETALLRLVNAIDDEMTHDNSRAWDRAFDAALIGARALLQPPPPGAGVESRPAVPPPTKEPRA